ncbi:DNA-formamidopyrimidine glycosylase [Planctomycetaceae bacterium SH139]
MPELPEVETMRRGIEPVVGGKIAALVRPTGRLQPIKIEPRFDRLKKHLIGRQIESIGRRGKRVLLWLCDASVVVIEPRMTGLVLLEQPPSAEHVRLRLIFDAPFPHEELIFWDRRGLGTVTWLSGEQYEQVLGPQRLGPDALEIECDDLRARLGHSQRAVKVALLDQKVVAGIGNLYASEILHLAGIDPRLTCRRLSGPQWRRLHRAIGLVLQAAILHEGSTLSDGTYRNALNNPGGYQNHHRVYDRAKSLCGRCQAGTIERLVQAQRSTFFCPVCQQKRGLHPLVDAL